MSLCYIYHLSEADRYHYRNNYESLYISFQDKGSPKTKLEVISRSLLSLIRHKAIMTVEIIAGTLLTSLGY